MKRFWTVFKQELLKEFKRLIRDYRFVVLFMSSLLIMSQNNADLTKGWCFAIIVLSMLEICDTIMKTIDRNNKQK